MLTFCIFGFVLSTQNSEYTRPQFLVVRHNDLLTSRSWGRYMHSVEIMLPILNHTFNFLLAVLSSSLVLSTDTSIGCSDFIQQYKPNMLPETTSCFSWVPSQGTVQSTSAWTQTTFLHTQVNLIIQCLSDLPIFSVLKVNAHTASSLDLELLLLISAMALPFGSLATG